jgi:hypothetical protein
MIKVVYGKKGAGKTKIMIDKANELALKCCGQIIFIDESNQLMYDLKHEIRFINLSEFPITEEKAFLGFICGIISCNYDIDTIFIDGLTYMLKLDISVLEGFFINLMAMAQQFEKNFYISINGDPETVPDFIKGYL